MLRSSATDLCFPFYSQMKLEYPPFELPDASQLRLTRRLVDVDEYLANIQQSSDKVTAFDMEWSQSRLLSSLCLPSYSSA